MNSERRAVFSSVAAICLASVLSSVSVLADSVSFVAIDAAGDATVVIARNSSAAAAGDLLGDAAEEWVAAIDGVGVVVSSGNGRTRGTIPGVDARALAIAGRRLYIALGGGILEMDLESEDSRYLMAQSAVALTAVDFDGDGTDKLVASLGSGELILLDPDTDQIFSFGNYGAVAVAGGDYFDRGYDQLAILSSGGGVFVLDVVEEDSTSCFLGGTSSSSSGACVSRGFSALPSGHIVTSLPGGQIVTLNPSTCELAEVDRSELDVTYGAVFTAIREISEVPPCELGQLTNSIRDDQLLLEWTADDDCCAAIIVTLGGEDIRRVAGTTRGLLIECAPGTYCIRCVSPDGTVSDPDPERHCVTIESCPNPPLPPCPIVEVLCRPTPEGDAIDVSWEARLSPDCACERFVVQDGGGREFAAVPGDVSSVRIPCASLGNASALTVVCIGPNGEQTTGSCDFEPCGPSGGLQRPGDCNQDGSLDLSDAICLLGHLFLGSPSQLPCGDGTVNHSANRGLLDSNGGGGVDLSDSVYLLTYLFLGGRPPALGTECITIPDCESRCDP